MNARHSFAVPSLNVERAMNIVTVRCDGYQMWLTDLYNLQDMIFSESAMQLTWSKLLTFKAFGIATEIPVVKTFGSAIHVCGQGQFVVCRTWHTLL